MPRDIATDLEVLDRVLSPAGRDIVDIGCGPGALVRELVARGARPIGVEISDEQLVAARAADPEGDAEGRYRVGRAERLPLGDRSVDVAVFMRTLHHVPMAEMPAALLEARRVVREDGAVYVAEPLPEGDFFELTSLVEDERQVRAAAQRAVADAHRAGLRRADGLEYEVRALIADVEHFLKRMVSVDPDRAAVFAERRAEIVAAFGALGSPGERPGERWFSQPMRADVLRPTG